MTTMPFDELGNRADASPPSPLLPSCRWGRTDRTTSVEPERREESMTKSRVVKGTSGLTHPDEVMAIHERILEASSARSRFVRVGSSGRVHVIEAGDGPPVVLLHGSSTSSLLLLPLLERLQGAWGIAVDRPGFGRVAGWGARRPRIGCDRACRKLDGWHVGTLVRTGASRTSSPASATRRSAAPAGHPRPPTPAGDGHTEDRGIAPKDDEA